MALHPSFPLSPYETLPLEHRWFPAAKELRSTAYEKLLPPQVASLTAEQHRELNEIARQSPVSVAWVIREAIDSVRKDDMPLLHVGKE